jgi:hypothetical protein
LQRFLVLGRTRLQRKTADLRPPRQIHSIGAAQLADNTVTALQEKSDEFACALDFPRSPAGSTPRAEARRLGQIAGFADPRTATGQLNPCTEIGRAKDSPQGCQRQSRHQKEVLVPVRESKQKSVIARSIAAPEAFDAHRVHW